MQAIIIPWSTAERNSSLLWVFPHPTPLLDVSSQIALGWKIVKFLSHWLGLTIYVILQQKGNVPLFLKDSTISSLVNLKCYKG